MKSITAKEYDVIKYDVRTIDVRTRQENRVLVRLNWAENVPIDELLSNYEVICPDKDEKIITVCNAGNRSSEAAEFLNEHGYENAYVLLGGIYGYKREFKD